MTHLFNLIRDYSDVLDLQLRGVYKAGEGCDSFSFVFSSVFNVILCQCTSSKLQIMFSYSKPYSRPSTNPRDPRTAEKLSTTLNYYKPIASSPEFCYTEDDHRAFDRDVMKEYNISSYNNPVPRHEDFCLSTQDRKRIHNKFMDKERQQLLSESTFNLNNSGSKILKVGLDVFEDCPCVKIQGKDRSIYFSKSAFESFLSELEDIVGAVKREEEDETFDLEDFHVRCCRKYKAARIISKKEIHCELYLGLVTLEKVIAMADYLRQKLNYLGNYLEGNDCPFKNFVEKVVDILDRRQQKDVSYNDLLTNLTTEPLVIHELVHKYPYFVIDKIEDYMQTYDDRFLYK
uniref:Uncharacterized protein n=2 Tax=Photinus pyralis TaxID=7054 RepID=A0A1Y1L3E2_PHOPY